jgi:hypothetical protein
LRSTGFFYLFLLSRKWPSWRFSDLSGQAKSKS